MTAAYGLPDRLIPLVARGVEIAASIVTPADGEYLGRSLVELAGELQEKCRVLQRHRDLLKPSEAASLCAVVEIAVEYATDVRYAPDMAFELASEEIIFTLQEIAHSGKRLVFV